ncbi:hypothetical protein HMPREF0591_5827, partial [Mycobacterium parascrofulaceum ATCC BAA-614]
HAAPSDLGECGPRRGGLYPARHQGDFRRHRQRDRRNCLRDHRHDEGPQSARLGPSRAVLLDPDIDRRHRHSEQEIARRPYRAPTTGAVAKELGRQRNRRAPKPAHPW